MLFYPAMMGGGVLHPGAVTFDGTNDYLSLSSSSVSDTAAFSLVFWINTRSQVPNVGDEVFATGEAIDNVNPLRVFFNANGTLRINANAVIGGVSTNFVRVDGSTDLSADSNWHCVMMSVDAGSSVQIYVGDTAETLTTTSNTSHNMGFSAASMEWVVGAIAGNGSGGSKLKADLAEVWFKAGTAIDFSVVANRRKFFSSSGGPAFLGSAGSVPTGSQPNIYLSLPVYGAVANNFAINKGSLGTFTVNGALTLASTYPG